MTKKEKTNRLNALVGSLSAPSKMPCSGYNIPAQECKIGSILRKIKDSTCSSCYALKGRYLFSNVKDAMYRRFEAIKKNYWVDSMVEQIKLNNKGDKRYFRWHDSGDVQSLEHIDKIVSIAEQLPEVKHWLPTREFKLFEEYINLHGVGKIPSNLTVRYSSHMNDRISNKALNKTYSSMVISSEDKIKEIDTPIKVCPATLPDSNHKCNDCRACWHFKGTIAYLKH